MPSARDEREDEQPDREGVVDVAAELARELLPPARFGAPARRGRVRERSASPPASDRFAAPACDRGATGRGRACSGAKLAIGRQP